jgi:protein-S-isoprenylcysteine O-methyltransferase Ste14
MKGLAALAFLMGLGFFFNAVSGQWALAQSEHGTIYVVYDILAGLGCWLVSWLLISMARAREVRRLMADEEYQPDSDLL